MGNNYFSAPKEDDLNYGRGYVYSLKYHIVWCTKYLRSVLIHGVDDSLKVILYQIASSMDIKISAMEVMPDHVHLLAECRPQICLSEAIQKLKGTSARLLFWQHPEIQKQLWGGHLWNPSYFVATVSDRSEAQIQRYIRMQKYKL